MKIKLRKHCLPEKYRNCSVAYLLKVVANNGDHELKETIRKAIAIEL